MSVLLSLLLVACVTVSMVVATSESMNHDEMMIANHLTTAITAAHSFRTFQTSAPTSSVFGTLTSVSDACKATSVSLETNSTIIAATNAVIASGCTKSSQQSCSSTTRTCTCIGTYSNAANLRSLVAQSGGQVCSIDIQFTASTSNGNLNFNYQGMGGLAVIGSSCTNNDIQATLSVFFDIIADGLRESSAKSSSTTKIFSISGTTTFCGASYTGTRSTNGAYNNNKPIEIIITLLISIIITIINQAL